MNSSTKQSEFDNKKITVLLIDDNQINNRLVASILMPQGFNIYIADNGQSGINLAYQMLPDIILLDIMMPEFSGFQVCEHLKKDLVTENLPIIFITADSSTATQIKAFQLGGCDFITKPIVDVVLLERIKHQIKLSQNHRRLETLNHYYELAEHLSNTGFWASHDIQSKHTFTFSSQFCKILELQCGTPEYDRLDLGSITAIMAGSKDSITRIETKKKWLHCIENGGVFDEICHCSFPQKTKYIRVCAHVDRQGPDVFNVFGALLDISQVINTENELSGLKARFEEITNRQHMVETNTQLAHELNQPLAAISLNVGYIRQLIETTPTDNSKVCEVINDVASDVTRATNIVKNIRRILHKQPVAINNFDLNELIDETIYVFNREVLQKEISLVYDHEDDPCIIRFNRTGLQQVIVNILKNAIEAIDQAEIDAPAIEITKTCTDSQINIFISDNGPGIEDEHKDEVFTQYYTSKKGNTGLGLGICKALMKEIDGDIVLAPPPANMKTCFKLIINRTL